LLIPPNISVDQHRVVDQRQPNAAFCSAKKGTDVQFERVERDGVTVHTVPELFEATGVGIAFTERGGGASEAPFNSLNLAGHVGDDPACVDANRMKLLDAIGIGALFERLTTAEQVHGTQVSRVGTAQAGAGASTQGGPHPIPRTDALWTSERGVPLLMFFADCVPIILVHPAGPAVAVVHAGWRGAAAGIAGIAAQQLAQGQGTSEILAFIGPHIGPCCYEVGPELVSHFDNSFVTITAAPPHLDLGAAVAADLERSGVPRGRQCHLGICTAHNTDRFYSYRADGITGRHGALAVIL
jgi:YfiH family protein